MSRFIFEIYRLIWDDNGTGASAFRKFKNALSKNKTLLKMPIPYHDLHSNLRVKKKNTEDEFLLMFNSYCVLKLIL